MEDTLSRLKTIEKKIFDIGQQIRLEDKLYSAELEERQRLNLHGEAAIKHYNEWMKRHHQEHLMVKEG